MKLFCGSSSFIHSEEMSQFWGDSPQVFANQSGSPKTSGVIFATENKCKQIRENTPSAGDTHGPAPRMQAVPVAQEVEVTQGAKALVCGCNRYCTH